MISREQTDDTLKNILTVPISFSAKEISKPGNMTLANLYPITASLGMVGYRSYDNAVNWNIGTCSCSLVLAVVISAILILCMKEREATQTKKKAKKVAPKKGW